MNTRYFDCDCSDFGHTFRFVLDEDDGSLWLEVQLKQYKSWYQRLWCALRYLFGRNVAYGHYDVTLIRTEDFNALRNLMDRAEKARKKS